MSLPEIISIHAPYKRVRPKYRKQVTAEAIISIHAPYKRVRPTSLIRRTGSLNFNPRTLQESATELTLQNFKALPISIHAPYKRVRLIDKSILNGL